MIHICHLIKAYCINVEKSNNQTKQIKVITFFDNKHKSSWIYAKQ